MVKQGFPGDSVSKESTCDAGDPGSSPGQKDPLEEEMATQSSVLAGGSPWTEEPGGLQSMGLQELDTTEWLKLSLFSYLQVQEPSEFQEAQIEHQPRHRIIKLLKTKGKKTLKAARLKVHALWVFCCCWDARSCIKQQQQTHVCCLEAPYVRSLALTAPSWNQGVVTCRLRPWVGPSPCSLVVLAEPRSCVGGWDLYLAVKCRPPPPPGAPTLWGSWQVLSLKGSSGGPALPLSLNLPSFLLHALSLLLLWSNLLHISFHHQYKWLSLVWLCYPMDVAC